MSETPLKTRIYSVVLVIVTAAALVYRFHRDGLVWTDQDIIGALLLGGMIVAADRFHIDFPHPAIQFSISAGAILALGSGLYLGPVVGACVVIASSLIADAWARLQPIQVAVNAANLGLATLCSAALYLWLASGAPTPLSGPRSILAVVVAGFVYTTVNLSVLAIIIAPVVSDSPFRIWRSSFSSSYVFVSLPTLGSLVPVVAAQSPFSVLILLVPLIGSHVAMRSLRKVQDETQATIESLVDVLELRDVYTHHHSLRVTEYVHAILEEMPNLPANTKQFILDASRVHDLGKVGIRDTSLLKTGPLTNEERQEMQRHSAIGADLVGHLDIYRQSAAIVRHHHERWDGRGYPDGVGGDAIPLGARIIAVADSFDAMTSNRSYRRGMSEADALVEIKRCSGTQFDPEIVAAFVQAMVKTQSHATIGQPETMTATSPAD